MIRLPQGLVAIFLLFIIFHIIYDSIIIYNMKNDELNKYCYKSLWYHLVVV